MSESAMLVINNADLQMTKKAYYNSSLHALLDLERLYISIKLLDLERLYISIKGGALVLRDQSVPHPYIHMQVTIPSDDTTYWCSTGRLPAELVATTHYINRVSCAQISSLEPTCNE